MPTVADALRRFAPAYLKQHSDSISVAQDKVLGAITRCRTGALGGVRYQCKRCQREHWVGRSCGNRHCPSCGHEKTQVWIEKQSAKLMPVHHFLVTFTVPREIGLVLRGSQREGYRCLFDASSQSIRDVGAATKSLQGCQLGFFGVLHTWGRDPAVYHPHIHYVVPGGGVKLDRHGQAESWQSTPKNFLFHHGTLVRVFKAKLADELRDAGLYAQVDRVAWTKKFVVDIQAVGHAVPTLKYLAPYVYRVAINDSRMVAVDDERVTYRIRRKGNRTQTKTVPGEAFVESFLQHVLPTGFMKIRHYGWMSANSKISIDEVKWLVWIMLGWTFWLGSGYAPQPKNLTAPMQCTECGGQMRVVEVTYQSLDSMGIQIERGLTYFDSG
ncbi:IS91 family transposase [Neorhodopirellula pilleata]|uniref:Putative transposase n=1 Tax=Neorhodopirellula pilleata TaxID=2714738 RepID=A0A5C6A427_9BACT|nr:transposase [Neorhodopirellula pilleata]TWT93173.1 putative transposase [Neorhodopirellula pilleata]